MIPNPIIPEPVNQTTGAAIFNKPNRYIVYLSQYRDIFDTWFLDNLSYGYTDDINESHIVFNIVDNHTTHCDEYSIHITDTIISIGYYSQTGFLYALASLKQLLSNTNIITGELYDYPKYPWRGVHIDVARHFMPMDFLYELVRNMGMLKLNKLHLHLCDDQGWRVEIKKYPLLHEKGSTRKETVIGKQFFPFFQGYQGDGLPYGGYYTQDQLRELVNYARNFGIEIIPEIDIPGHATAMLSAYPQYAAHNPPDEPQTRWGIFNHVMSPSDESLQFLRDIFSEIMDIFPSQYIHIGGDEVPLKYYQKSSVVREMATRGILSSYKDAPDYILGNIAAYITSKGRTPILWDEGYHIAQQCGGMVMAWQSMEIMHHVAQQNVPYICSSSSHFYFDYYQHPDTATEPLAIGGYTPLRHVYDAPIPTDNHLQGFQANIWTEYMKTSDQVRYMLYPRIYGLAEVAWGRNRQDWEIFESKVKNLK
jgi:hexosaminidase